MEIRYCYTCGTQVKVTERIWSYDELTGKPKTVLDVKCPNKKWYQFESHPQTDSEAYCFQA